MRSEPRADFRTEPFTGYRDLEQEHLNEPCECGHPRRKHDADADFDVTWVMLWGHCEVDGCPCAKFEGE